MRTEDTAIVAQLAELVASLERDGVKTASGLRELLDTGLRHVAGSQYAGITLAEKNKTVTNVVSTHRYPKVLDSIQNQFGEGPCLEAAWQHHVILINDLDGEQRWPRYRRHAIEQTPIRSILSFQMAVDGGNIAALNFYADEPQAFSDDAVMLGDVFATHTALPGRSCATGTNSAARWRPATSSGRPKASSWSGSTSTRSRRSSCSPGCRSSPTPSWPTWRPP